jgi:hypothetical protein
METGPRHFLVNYYNALNDEGSRLSRAVEAAVRPTLTEWVHRGYSAQEIRGIALQSLDGILSEIVLRRALDKRKVERSSNKTPSAE